jgi:hypothetical protein
MTGNTSARGRDDGSPEPGKKGLNRLLIEQFYQDSIARYGTASEQARALSRHLYLLPACQFVPQDAIADDIGAA